jgi:NitT/TauT family transport system permease protein
MLKAVDRFLPLMFFICFVVCWQLIVDIFAVPTFILPAPSAILQRIAESPSRMMLHLLVTLQEVLAGFALALAGGVILAVLVSQSRFLSRTLYPLLVVTQTVPTVAIAPILVVWFGPGNTARLIVVFLIAFFPIFVNFTTGLIRVDEDLIDLVHGLNGSRWKTLSKIRFPSAMPHLFTGMRISITFAVIGAVVGEFVASSQGLGFLVFSGSTNMDTRLVFAAVVLLAVIGIALFQLVRALQIWALPWARDTAEGDF